MEKYFCIYKGTIMCYNCFAISSGFQYRDFGILCVCMIERDVSILISNTEPNMTETDINFSESFIYRIKKKEYYKYSSAKTIEKSSKVMR